MFGGLLLVFDKLHGINDQGLSFAISMAYYYLNYLTVLLLNYLKIKLSLVAVILLGMPQWIVLSVAGSAVINSVYKKNDNVV